MRKSRVVLIVVACAAIAVAVSTLAFGSSSATAQARTTLPGTGVSLVLPDGVVVAPFGTTHTDASRQIVIGIASGSVERDLTKSAAQMALYPDPSETFTSQNLTGTLYKRTRKNDGGGWDGWWLNVVKGNYTLAVMISYSGNTPGKFEELRKYLSTVTWDGSQGDPELAFGMKLTVSGLKLARPGIGSLLYTADGRADWNQRHLYVYTTPGSLQGNSAAFRRICEATASKMLAGKTRTPMRYETSDGINACDTWSNATLEGTEYYAVLMLPDGSVIQATGLGDPDVFQHSLLASHRMAR